jgi:hypothetical protein
MDDRDLNQTLMRIVVSLEETNRILSILAESAVKVANPILQITDAVVPKPGTVGFDRLEAARRLSQ